MHIAVCRFPNSPKSILYPRCMLSSDEIKFYLNLFSQFSLFDLKDLFSISRIVKLPANAIYIDNGSNTKKLGYITEGLIRAFAIKENGDDVTFILRWEKQFIASHDTIIRKQPSKFIYQAIEDTVLFEFDYEQAEILLDKNPRLSNFRNMVNFEIIAEALDRAESLVLLSPEERYLQLVREKPNIINRVPGKYIATFLGITPVSLSRIRKRIATPGKRN